MADYEEHLNGSENIIVAFAGGAQTEFEFGSTLEALGVSYVLMRDRTGRCHGHGVTGLGDLFATLEYIRWLSMRNFNRVTTLGLSLGAYAALLYGQLAPVDRTIAISPVTGRELDGFAPEWHHRLTGAGAEMADLRQYFPNGPMPQTVAFVSDGSGTELDMQMAQRIGITDIRLIMGYSHADLARGLRDTGILQEVLLA